MSVLARASRQLVFRAPRQARSVVSKPNNPMGAEYVANPAAPPQSTQPFGLSRFAQANFFRSNAVFVAATLGAAAVASGLYDSAFQTLWEINNRGKLYKDIIKRYPGLPPNCEPEEA